MNKITKIVALGLFAVSFAQTMDIEDLEHLMLDVQAKKIKNERKQLKQIHQDIQKGILDAPPAGWTEKYNKRYNIKLIIKKIPS